MPPHENAAYLISPRYWRWLGSRASIAVLLWLVALGIGGQRLWHAWHSFDNNRNDPPERQRADGNSGHAEIDFGGQWLMGRMIVTGQARKLYHRDRQWAIVQAAYPLEDQPPMVREDRLQPGANRFFSRSRNEDLRTDAEWMMFWFMGEDSPELRTLGGSLAAMLAPNPLPIASVATTQAAIGRISPAVVEELAKPRIGGPLYPPIHAFVMAPFAVDNDPQSAYRIAQVLWLVLAYLAALGVSVLSRGWLPWSIASMLVLLYPGCRGCLDLAQNSTLTLTIVIWGWVLASRGWSLTGGAAWGLLAIKPTWAVAFLLVPLFTRRWRFLFAMAGVGGALVLATLPFVGVQVWLDWLQVGSKAQETYDVNQNWIHLSRDLNGLPRRWLIDFQRPEAERHNERAAILGTSLWLGVLLATAAITLTRVDRRRFVGLGPAFLFLGAYLSCLRFMYYDTLLSFAAVAVLIADRGLMRRAMIFQSKSVPIEQAAAIQDAQSAASAQGDGRWVGYINSLPLTIVVSLGLYENVLIASNIRSTISLGFLEKSSTGTPRIEVDVPLQLALDTMLLVALWAWLGVRLLLEKDQTPRSESSAAPMSGERISDSPTSTA